ncbi:hypothetical protein JCM3770_001285 [Rhodotorula araucariae]
MLVRTALVAVVALAASTHAQTPSSLVEGISSTCQAAALSLLSNRGLANCSQVGSLSSIALTKGSIVEPVNTWLGKLCSGEDCSADTIHNASAVIENGCSAEISAGHALAKTVLNVISNFNQVKEGICLQYASNGTLCVTNLLESVQTAAGQDLTVSYITSLDASKLASVDTTSFCTDCAHGIVTKLNAVLSVDGPSTPDKSPILSAVVSACGDSFADGQVPDAVSAAAEPTANSTTVNGVESHAFNGAPSVSAGLWKAVGVAILGAAGIGALA